MAETETFDAARYLVSPQSQAELLNDALASGEASYIAHALGVIARARGMTEVAREAGVTREALYKSLSEDVDPRLTTLMGVARALGVTLSASLVRDGSEVEGPRRRSDHTEPLSLVSNGRRGSGSLERRDRGLPLAEERRCPDPPSTRAKSSPTN